MNDNGIVDISIEDTHALADVVELNLIAGSLTKASVVTLSKYLAQKYSIESQDAQEKAELILQQFKWRGRYRPVYPFREENRGKSIKYDANPNNSSMVYAFLLCLCISKSFRAGGRYQETDQTFDYLVLISLRTHLGENSQGRRFGWPPSEGRPTNFQEALSWLATEMGLQRGNASVPPNQKDGGVDVVVWRPFSDRSTGFITILAQCTVQQSHWDIKGREVVSDSWRGWIDFETSPVNCLAIPFTVPKDYPKRGQLNRTVGLMLDRFRLCELVRFAVDKEYNNFDLWLSDLQKWTFRELESIKNAA